MTAHERLPGKYDLRVADYAMLAEAGAFGDRRTELIDGDVIVTTPEFRPHAFLRDELQFRLRTRLEGLSSDLFATSGSVALCETTMPQPDIVLTSEPRGEGPIPVLSVALLGEVSSTTVDRDLGLKQRLYAAAGIPEYLIVDLPAATIRQFWSPADGAYGEQREVAFGGDLSAATIPGLIVATTGL